MKIKHYRKEDIPQHQPPPQQQQILNHHISPVLVDSLITKLIREKLGLDP